MMKKYIGATTVVIPTALLAYDSYLVFLNREGLTPPLTIMLLVLAVILSASSIGKGVTIYKNASDSWPSAFDLIWLALFTMALAGLHWAVDSQVTRSLAPNMTFILDATKDGAGTLNEFCRDQAKLGQSC